MFTLIISYLVTLGDRLAGGLRVASQCLRRKKGPTSLPDSVVPTGQLLLKVSALPLENATGLAPDLKGQLVKLQQDVDRLVSLITTEKSFADEKTQQLRLHRLELLETEKLALLWTQCKGNLLALNTLSQEVLTAAKTA